MVKTFFKNNIVFFIAMTFAIITMFFVPPDHEYLKYFDYKTLTSLFLTLAVINCFRNIQFFRVIARKIVAKFKTTRSVILALNIITFLFSLIIANDMALLTFLPLACIILSKTNQKKYMAFTFIMLNISANLGGMLTPFGNPQNLYLFSYFNLSASELMVTMLPYFGLSLVLIFICCMLIKKTPIVFENDLDIKFDYKRSIVYLLMFTVVILIIFRVIPFYVGLVGIPLLILLFDYKALLKVDYMLLLTFVVFFIFAGNMARIPAVNKFLLSLMQKDAFITSILSCQIISNVPSSILLSHFTTNFIPLLIGVNVGGVGTIISSLASLITLKEYGKENKGKGFSYILKFTSLNFLFLFTLIGLFYLLNFLIY